MVDLTEGAKPIPGDIHQKLHAQAIWGGSAIFCLGDNPDWGAGQHAPAWHHRDYHVRYVQPRVAVRFAWYDMWVGVFYDKYKRTFFICPLPCLLITYRRKSR